MSQTNRTYRKTARKVEEGHQFASEWHRQMHEDAGRAMRESDQMWDGLGIALAAIFCVIFPLIVMSVQ